MIEARDLTKRYGDKVAVDHLSFTVQPGRVTGFLGPNGAGKSTTIRMMLGLQRPDRGLVSLFGQPLKDRRLECGECIGHRIENLGGRADAAAHPKDRDFSVRTQ